jgi:glycosyltransferase involved in cell wall biosynthesis
MAIKMKNITPLHKVTGQTNGHGKLPLSGEPGSVPLGKLAPRKYQFDTSAEILVISSYPPRKCGIATYSQDLVRMLNKKFRCSFAIKICALESGPGRHDYPDEVEYTLDTTINPAYSKMAQTINSNDRIKIVLVQHEFGFFRRHEDTFLQFLKDLRVPVLNAFHTVILKPDEELRARVKNIADASASVIVMTNNSAKVLREEYGLPRRKIMVIPHGTHLVTHPNKDDLKQKHGLAGRKVLTTFGLLGSGKKIETTLGALPSIIKTHPDVIFLVIGKTHPEIIKNEGEQYRKTLESMVRINNLENHVKFINSYVSLPLLLEYLQLTDIYLFTSNDPNQAVSGTFAYAMSCGCPIVSTPIPHAKEILTDDTGIIFNFLDSEGLAAAVHRLLSDELLLRKLSINALQKMVPTAWENSAIAHAGLFEKVSDGAIRIRFNYPGIDLMHMKRMTTDIGIIQFSKINEPDIESGYTLDDNARALVASCMYFKLTGDKRVFDDINRYLSFIRYCLQPAGNFLNYVDKESNFSDENYKTNLDDANGRAFWALGYLISLNGQLPADIISEAIAIAEKSRTHLVTVYSPRAMAFVLKGLYYYYRTFKNPEDIELGKIFGNRLAHLYKHESDNQWFWFEDSMTYANSILPEGMLYAWLLTGDKIYKVYSVATLNFLLSKIFNENGIEVISNRGWLQKGEVPEGYGEQPIDVAYTIMTLSKFYEAFNDPEYLNKMVIAFNWFLGKNRLRHIVYNPVTGGCYDGLEETHVNLNQGAESTVSYLMARMTMEKYSDLKINPETDSLNHSEIGSKQQKSTISQSK